MRGQRTSTWAWLFAAISSSWILQGESVTARADEAHDERAVEEERARERRRKRAERRRASEKLEVLPGTMARPIGIPKGRGLWAGTPNRDYILKVSGFTHLDWRSSLAPAGGVEDLSQLFVRRARMSFEGTLFGRLDYRMLFDVVSERAPIDAYLDYRIMPEVNIRVGRFKSPFGFERRARAYALVFNERGLPTRLAPNRDFGVFVHGQTRDGFFSYDVALLGGSMDYESIHFYRGAPDAAVRLYFQPFRLGGASALKHLGFGVSATVGDERGEVGDTRLSPLNTSSGRPIFRYREGDEGAIADGLRHRWSLHGHFRKGRWNALVEHVESTQVVRAGEETSRLTHRAWMGHVSVALTDDENGFFGISPSRPFSPKNGQYGAFSLAVRYHELHVDRRSFPVFSDDGASARIARAGTLSLQWHMNLHLELQLDAEVVGFRGGAPMGGDAPHELALFGRVELSY